MSIIGTDKIMQVAIIVRDIETTKKKFADFFEIEPPPHFDGGKYEVTGAEYMGKPAPKANCFMCFFNIGEGLQLELIQPNGEPSTWQDFLDEKGEGLHHLAFGVKDMDSKIEICEKKGWKLAQRGKYGDASGQYAYLDSNKDLKFWLELLESF